MEQITIGEGSSLAGRTMLEATLRQRFGVIVVGIQREDGRDGVQSLSRTRDAAGRLSRRARPADTCASSKRRPASPRVRSRFRSTMSARLLDGRRWRRRFAPRRFRTCTRSPRRPDGRPGLGIVLVGDDPASEIYVRNKVRAGSESGLWADLQRLPATATLDDLLGLVDRLNASDAHDGILVQSPLPAAMGATRRSACSTRSIPTRTSTASHPSTSAGWSRAARILMPCTPSGVIEMLGAQRYRDRRRRAVVIGRSEIVGKPMAHAAAAARCDRHDLPFEDAGPSRRRVQQPTS